MAFDILRPEFESDIDKIERWLSSQRMFCARLSCPNGELNALDKNLNLRLKKTILDKNS